MNKIKSHFEQIFVARHLIKWTLLVLPLSLITGCLVAFFLWSLELVTQLRWQYDWLLYLLPLSGILIHFLYKWAGKNAEAGNNLIIDEIHEPGGGVPARMTPLVLISTVITHLFGGSAGREGTAVQMGGSMAGMLGRWYKLPVKDMRILLMTGIAGGFGAVFGTPVAGAVFALEVLTIGHIRYDALIPCLITSFLSNTVCGAWGIHHTHYTIAFVPSVISISILCTVALAGVAFGLTARAFAMLTHAIKNIANKYIEPKWLIPVAGGCLIILLTYLLGTTDYLGLGVYSQNPKGVSIVNSFITGGVTHWNWLWKLLFTAITLGSGFKGGEVTPLFFIGATLGNTIAMVSGAPVDLMAGLGFIAVFAGATNTPLACIMMGAELFGSGNILYYAIACCTAYYFSGHTGIYSAQRRALSKYERH